ncbi:hypothetical protein [Mesorhizobium sp. M0129]|uniref:hypothetical protein n=1 Tax=Mesorhizobium sp. M0129 TaxID=2956886 RepID=UPI0033366813
MGSSLADRKPVVGTKSKQRSRIGNGTDLLPGVDGRSPMLRRWRELVAQFVSDMGGDPPETKRTIAKRASALIVWCESAESKMANGEDLDITAYTTAANSLRRHLVDIGLERKARDITPTLEQYLRQNHGEAA